eukprot:1953944-Rhodomonas_salina.1
MGRRGEEGPLPPCCPEDYESAEHWQADAVARAREFKFFAREMLGGCGGGYGLDDTDDEGSWSGDGAYQDWYYDYGLSDDAW